MSGQLSLNLETGKHLRNEGIRRVSVKNSDWLARARAVAVAVAEQKGWVCADDVRQAMCDDLPTSSNAFGAIFKAPEFEFSGRFRPSCAVSRHAGLQRIWILKRRTNG